MGTYLPSVCGVKKKKKENVCVQAHQVHKLKLIFTHTKMQGNPNQKRGFLALKANASRLMQEDPGNINNTQKKSKQHRFC